MACLWLLGYLAGVSVNCRGDLESLNDTTATNGTEFQAFLDANGIDFLTSNGEPDLGEASCCTDAASMYTCWSYR